MTAKNQIDILAIETATPHIWVAPTTSTVLMVSFPTYSASTVTYSQSSVYYGNVTPGGVDKGPEMIEILNL